MAINFRLDTNYPHSFKTDKNYLGSNLDTLPAMERKMRREMIKTVGIKGVIQTFSGKYINILDPQPQDFAIEDIAHHLSMLCRFNGASKYFYSVAEHSYLVSHHIKDDLKAAALLHDAAEAYVGDLISPLKSLLPEFKAIEDNIQSAIYNKFGIELSEADEHEIVI